MFEIQEKPDWEQKIKGWDVDDLVEGGPDGVDNVPIRQLANRTAFLKEHMGSQSANAALAADTGTGTDTGTPAVPSASVGSILQTVWAKIRQVANVANGKAPANVALAADTGTGTDTTTPAVASATVASVLQTVWAKIRQVANAKENAANKKTSVTDSDTDFPTGKAVKNQLDLKAPLASPAFTGTPKVPGKTSAAANDGTLIATEAQVALKADTSNVTRYYALAVGGDTDHFYPCVWKMAIAARTAFITIHSRNAGSSDPWNQNVLRFAMDYCGWSDMPKRLQVYTHSLYDKNEVTINSIYAGKEAGNNAVYLRGGLTYYVEANVELKPYTAAATLNNETFAVLDTNGNGDGFVNADKVWDKDSGAIIVNNLTSAYTDRALSAAQGKVLQANSEYTFIIDSDAKLKAWADNAAGNDYSRVLVKAKPGGSAWKLDAALSGGTGTNPVAVIDLSGAPGKPDTKSVTGEAGSRIAISNSAPVQTYVCGIKGRATGTFPNFTDSGNDYFFRGVNIEASLSGPGSAYAFSNCGNLANCTGYGSSPSSGSSGFSNCVNLSGCSGRSSGNGGAGFESCTKLSGCTGTGGGSSTGGGQGFYGCYYLSNCAGAGNGNASSNGFSGCYYLSNCIGTGAGNTGSNGFSSCRYLSSCAGTCKGGASGAPAGGFSSCESLSNCTGGSNGQYTYGFVNCRTGFGCRGPHSNCFMDTGTGATAPWNSSAAGGWNAA